MANNYLQFSEAINVLTQEEIAWIQKRIPEMEKKYEESQGEEGWNFGWKIKAYAGEQPHLWLYAEESAEPDHVAKFAQEFIRKFRPKASFYLSWASFCDKLRLGEFGGGAVFVTAKKILWNSSWDFVDSQFKKFEKGKK